MSWLGAAIVVFVVLFFGAATVALSRGTGAAHPAPGENVAVAVAGIAALVVAGLLGALIRKSLYC